MAFVLTNILTWELTEGLICILVHTELARLQTTGERATSGHEENSAWVVICMYLTMGKGKHVQFCKGNLIPQGPVLSCLCRQQLDLHVEQFWYWDGKSTKRLSFPRL